MTSSTAKTDTADDGNNDACSQQDDDGHEQTEVRLPDRSLCLLYRLLVNRRSLRRNSHNANLMTHLQCDRNVKHSSHVLSDSESCQTWLNIHKHTCISVLTYCTWQTSMKMVPKAGTVQENWQRFLIAKLPLWECSMKTGRNRSDCCCLFYCSN